MCMYCVYLYLVYIYYVFNARDSCPRRKTGIVKQSQQFLIRHNCFTMPMFRLGQPKIMQCLGLNIFIMYLTYKHIYIYIYIYIYINS